MTLPMRRPSRRQRGRSIQAAGKAISFNEGRLRAEEPSAGGGFPWQARGWRVYRELGLIHYAMSFIRDNVALLDFYAAEIPDDPEEEAEPLDLDNPAAVEVERLGAGPYGSVSALIAELVVHDKVAGEGWLGVRFERDGEPIEGTLEEPPEDSDEIWEVLTAQTRHRRRTDPKLRPAQTVRIWRPDPERPEWPDSSLRSVLAECEQLLLIQQMTTGTLQSRLHNGVFLAPEELDPSQAGPPDEGDDEMSPLMRDMFQVFSAPINDPGAAAAIMPYLLFGKAEWIDKVKHISMSREFDKFVLELALHLAKTIAGGIDLPAERLTGIGDINHWGQWLIDDITYSQHLAPAVDLVVDGLEKAWLRPAWSAAGLDADRFGLVVDATRLTSRVRKGADAVQAYKLGELSGEALRRELGFDESYAPTDDDPGLRGQVSSRDTDLPGDRDTVDQAPPDTVTAAATVEDLGMALADIDDRVLSDLLALADEAIASEAADAEERLVEAMAAAGITADTPDLAQALADAGVSPAAVVPDDAFESLIEPAAGRMADAIAQAGDVIETATGTSITPSGDEVANVAAGATFLTVAMTDWLRSRWFNPRPGGDNGLARFARGADIEGQPIALLREAMTTAGGGRGATPGSVGLTGGQTVEGWLEQAGLAVRAYRWRYGSPPESFPPHRRLAGVIFDGPDDERIANTSNRWPHNFHWYPMDHSGCRCRWERVLVPVETVP